MASVDTYSATAVAGTYSCSCRPSVLAQRVRPSEERQRNSSPRPSRLLKKNADLPESRLVAMTHPWLCKVSKDCSGPRVGSYPKIFKTIIYNLYD